MPDSSDILRLRVLMCFLKEESEACTVTEIARTLGEEKYTASRALAALEKEGLVDRSNPRHPKLTDKGQQEAERYGERIHITLNHLLYEGVDVDSARSDAFYWALYCSDQTMAAVRATEERYRVKYELRDQKRFGGAVLCDKMKNGSYQQPFLIYRDHVKNGSNISMGNEGFEHPCTLHIENGEGTIHLHAVNVSANSGLTGKLMRGKIKKLQYFCNGIFVSAEKNGDVLSFPASALSFVNMGAGTNQILHGSVCLKMQCSVGPVHMPESTAIFTILI